MSNTNLQLLSQLDVRQSEGNSDAIYAAAAESMIREASRYAEVAKREISFLEKKIKDKLAVLALLQTGDTHKLVGFGFISVWSDGFLSHSGLVVNPEYRGYGLGLRLKKMLMQTSTTLYPGHPIFSITTSPAVKSFNESLGFLPCPLTGLTTDPEFWAGCRGCRRYNAINEEQLGEPTPNGEHCCCSGMVWRDTASK